MLSICWLILTSLFLGTTVLWMAWCQGVGFLNQSLLQRWHTQLITMTFRGNSKLFKNGWVEKRFISCSLLLSMFNAFLLPTFGYFLGFGHLASAVCVCVWPTNPHDIGMHYDFVFWSWEFHARRWAPAWRAEQWDRRLASPAHARGHCTS